MENKKFDYEAFKKEAEERPKKGGVFTQLFKEFLEEAQEGELDAHLQEDPDPKRKNGKGKKRVKTPNGEVQIDTPRDARRTLSCILNGKCPLVLGLLYPSPVCPELLYGAHWMLRKILKIVA